ncbi:BON domain-containing protein [Sphingomonas sp. R86520]|uniref:BON domain-containing protein n=1 Tax=Sphingomonas sp. R86520 TaxID=3093859 RepID=UPI0036D32196
MFDDIKLQKAVLAELNWDPSVPAAQIGVTASGGIVTLTGHVGSYAAKFAAERAAARVEGVKAIAEELDVQLEDRFKRGDEAIAGAIVERFSWDTTIPKDAVKAQVEDGWVSLRGEVRWHFEKEAAETAVRTLAGVIGVLNHVTVTPRVDVLDVRDDIRTALHRSPFFDTDTIKVSVDGGTVRLSGSVDTLHDRRVAEKTAWAAPGAVKVENFLEVV